MAALVTFGVDADVLSVYLPQVSLGGSDDLYTTARITTLVGHKAAYVGGVLRDIGLDPASMTAGEDDYTAAQRLVALLVSAAILGGIRNLDRDGVQAKESLEAEARAALAALRTNPGELGADDASHGTQAWTTVSRLSNTPSVRENRRKYDADGGYTW